MKLRAYDCAVRGTNWNTTIHALTAGQAKSFYFRSVHEAWQSVRFTDIICHVAGPPRDTEKFKHTAQYRGVKFHIGDQVKVGGSLGFVVDSNASANFQVLFTEGRFCGNVLSVHPSEIQFPVGGVA